MIKAWKERKLGDKHVTTLFRLRADRPAQLQLFEKIIDERRLHLSPTRQGERLDLKFQSVEELRSMLHVQRRDALVGLGLHDGPSVKRTDTAGRAIF